MLGGFPPKIPVMIHRCLHLKPCSGITETAAALNAVCQMISDFGTASLACLKSLPAQNRTSFLNGLKMNSDNLAAELKPGKLRPCLPAGCADPVNAMSPVIGVPAPEKYIGNILIARNGAMRRQQSISCPAVRKDAAVTDNHLFIAYPDLDRNAEHISIMGKSVKNSFPDSRSGKRVSLRSPVRRIIDPGLQIFEINEIHHLICNPNERTFQSVLIWRIGAGSEFADSDTAAILNYPGIPVKQKNRRFLKLAVRHKMELAEKFSIGDIELFLSHPFAAESLAPENLKTLFIQILSCHVIGSFLLPAGSGLSHDKFRESNT